MRRWAVDVVEAEEGGKAAAGNADQGTRIRAFEALCRSLGEVATAYACPRTAARDLVREAARAYQAVCRERRASSEPFTTIRQLIGPGTDRVLYQVEYVENGSDEWTWIVHSQHQAVFRNPLDLSEHRWLDENAERAAITDANKLSETYEDVRMLRISVRSEWISG